MKSCSGFMELGRKPVSTAQIAFSKTGSIPAALAACAISGLYCMATPEGGGVSGADGPPELPTSPAAANAASGLRVLKAIYTAAAATSASAAVRPRFIFAPVRIRTEGKPSAFARAFYRRRSPQGPRLPDTPDFWYSLFSSRENGKTDHSNHKSADEQAAGNLRIRRSYARRSRDHAGRYRANKRGSVDGSPGEYGSHART